MTRKVYKDGRFVIPKDEREKHGIEENDWLEVISTPEGILLRKYVRECSLCDKTEGVQKHGKAYLCQTCAAKLNEAS